jgi:uncharacterized protein YgiM (DUF1202 family)
MRVSKILCTAALVSAFAAFTAHAQTPREMITEVAVVSPGGALMHAEAGSEHAVIARLAAGDQARVVFQDGPWAKLRHPELGDGWVLMRQVTVRWALVQVVAGPDGQTSFSVAGLPPASGLSTAALSSLSGADAG